MARCSRNLGRAWLLRCVARCTPTGRPTTGARRKLRVRLPESISAEQLAELVGHKMEQLVDSGETSHVEPHPSPHPNDGSGEEGDIPSRPPPATHAMRLEFSSVSTAIAVKASLEALPGKTAVSGVDFIVDPVATAEEIQAMMPANDPAPIVGTSEDRGSDEAVQCTEGNRAEEMVVPPEDGAPS